MFYIILLFKKGYVDVRFFVIKGKNDPHLRNVVMDLRRNEGMTPTITAQVDTILQIMSTPKQPRWDWLRAMWRK